MHLAPGAHPILRVLERPIFLIKPLFAVCPAAAVPVVAVLPASARIHPNITPLDMIKAGRFHRLDGSSKYSVSTGILRTDCADEDCEGQACRERETGLDRGHIQLLLPIAAAHHGRPL